MELLAPWPSDRAGVPLMSRSLSLSGLLVAEAGADELVGVVMSMGSLSGADIWMVGVRIGTVRGAIGSSLPCPSPSSDLCGLSITCAICALEGRAVSIWSRTAGGEREGGR